MMKSIAFVVIYYGKFPNYFSAWLNSCRQNPTVDFLVFTDNPLEEYILPPNVHVIILSFEELRERFQCQYDFKISLERPYKLCDFRPAYGEALQEWLHEYDYWGHCDTDMLWGDIRKFATDDLLNQYDRIFNAGHCSIYRNEPRVNALYRTLDPHGCLNWRDVFSSEQNCTFDEYATLNDDGSGGGMSRIMEVNKERIYATWKHANVTPKQQARFQLSLDDHERECDPYQIKEFLHRYYSSETEAEMQFFERTQDGLFMWYCKDGKVQKKEYMYVHFSRRAIHIPKDVIECDNYLFLPPAKILPLSKELTEEEVKTQMQKNHSAIRWYKFKQKSKLIQLLKRLTNKMKRIMRE